MNLKDFSQYIEENKEIKGSTREVKNWQTSETTKIATKPRPATLTVAVLTSGERWLVKSFTTPSTANEFIGKVKLLNGNSVNAEAIAELIPCRDAFEVQNQLRCEHAKV